MIVGFFGCFISVNSSRPGCRKKKGNLTYLGRFNVESLLNTLSVFIKTNPNTTARTKQELVSFDVVFFGSQSTRIEHENLTSSIVYSMSGGS